MYFSYGEKEIEYLKSRDKVLGEIIDKVGHVYREVDTDLFSSVVHHIVGQQISTKAQATIWNRMKENTIQYLRLRDIITIFAGRCKTLRT